jgi:hypothetical protein
MITREELITMQSLQRLEKKIPDITLRDLFAMNALNGTLRGTTYTDNEIKIKVEQAYKIADMMLNARELKE